MTPGAAEAPFKPGRNCGHHSRKTIMSNQHTATATAQQAEVPDVFPLTLAQARNHPDIASCMTLDHLSVTPIEMGMLAARWLRLLGFDKGEVAAALMAAADEDFFGDVPLLAALAGSAAEFKAWWLKDDASIYCMTDATGSEEWAVDVLARAPNDWPQHLLS